jgi:hypothetical protein
MSLTFSNSEKHWFMKTPTATAADRAAKQAGSSTTVCTARREVRNRPDAAHTVAMSVNAKAAEPAD